jgi:hypothetical protein
MAAVGSVGGKGYGDCGTEVMFLPVFLAVLRNLWYCSVLAASGEGAGRLPALCANRAWEETCAPAPPPQCQRLFKDTRDTCS